MEKKKGFTLIELLVVISIIALLIGILLPALGAARRNANMMKNSTQTRSIVQAAMTHASQNSDKLPGLRKKAPNVVPADEVEYSNLDGENVEARYAIMLEGSVVDAAILLSPGDTRTDSFKIGTDANVLPDHYSYAMLEIEAGGGRNKVWNSGDVSSVNPIVCDRLTEGTTAATYKSYWSSSSQNWIGSVGFGDTHAEFVDSESLADTRFTNATCDPDDLFKEDTGGTCAGQNNAVMIQHGSAVANVLAP
jgi:prepilin-type N-terminal cleavage/methylation domain-containing protein